jgi:hypothetical protein
MVDSRATTGRRSEMACWTSSETWKKRLLPEMRLLWILWLSWFLAVARQALQIHDLVAIVVLTRVGVLEAEGTMV